MRARVAIVPVEIDEEVLEALVLALFRRHGDRDTSIPGVLSSAELHSLERAKGAAFAQAWLRKLFAHEQGAVKLAADAIEDGQNADVVFAGCRAKNAGRQRGRVEPRRGGACRLRRQGWRPRPRRRSRGASRPRV